MSTQVFVANCRPHNWQACEKETIFGLKLGWSLPPLQVGDLILVRITGTDYGVKALWYFKESAPVNDSIAVPWTDGKYGWILRCKPIITLPRLFSEDFRTSSKLSTKIPNFPVMRILPSIIRLKNIEAQAYLQNLLQEFENDFRVTFDYLGETKSVDGFLEEILSTLDKRPGTTLPTKSRIPAAPLTPEGVEEKEDKEEDEDVGIAERVIPSFGVVGERVDLPILNYAPLNEHGVVLLFGYYLQDLGFSHLEEIRSEFPDAIGMRPVGNGKYKRVRIEFEFKSSSFTKHGHPIDGCDVIVCWIHDWNECPLEVIELSSALFQDES